MLYVRQEDTANLHPTSIQNFLEDTARMKFMDSVDNHCSASEDLSNNNEVSVHIFIMPFQHVLWEIKNYYYKKFQIYKLFWMKIYILVQSKEGPVENPSHPLTHKKYRSEYACSFIGVAESFCDT